MSGPASGRPTSSAPTGSPSRSASRGALAAAPSLAVSAATGFFTAAFGSTRRPPGGVRDVRPAVEGAARLTAVRFVVAVVVTVAVRAAELLVCVGVGVDVAAWIVERDDDACFVGGACWTTGASGVGAGALPLGVDDRVATGGVLFAVVPATVALGGGSSGTGSGEPPAAPA